MYITLQVPKGLISLYWLAVQNTNHCVCANRQCSCGEPLRIAMSDIPEKPRSPADWQAYATSTEVTSIPLRQCQSGMQMVRLHRTSSVAIISLWHGFALIGYL